MFWASSMKLPTYMLAIKPQAISGCSLIMRGPGWMPNMMNAPISTAVVPELGMPSVRSGTKAPELAALFADSGPATPSIMPVPNLSGVFERRLSSP